MLVCMKRATGDCKFCSYILRLWQEGEARWRVGVRLIPDGEWQQFLSLEQATAYIAQQLGDYTAEIAEGAEESIVDWQ